jgi:hypothetical protein
MEERWAAVVLQAGQGENVQDGQLGLNVIASKRSNPEPHAPTGLLRRFDPRNDALRGQKISFTARH